MTDIRLPMIGFSMSEGTLAEWLVEDGATVAAGQVIYALEIDKSTQEIEAPVAGTITLLGQTGETYDVGTLLATIG